MSRQKSSSGDNVHPYLKPQFWQENPFWENAYYTEAGKEYLRNSVKEMLKNERKHHRLNENPI